MVDYKLLTNNLEVNVMKKNNDKNQVNTTLEKELVNMIRRGVSLDFISMEHRTRTVCLEAVIRYPYEIKYVPTKAPFYMELAELASRLNGDVISCIDRYKITDRIIKNAIDSDPRNITYAVNSGIDHDKLHNIMIGIVTKDPCLFDYLPTTGNDDDIIDLDVVENAIRKDGELLCRVHPSSRNETLCETALFGTNWYHIIPFIPKEFRTTLVEKLINNIRQVLEEGEDKESNPDVWYNYYGELKTSSETYVSED